MEVYLDSASTTMVLDEIIEKMSLWAKEQYGNPSSLHRKGVEVERTIKETKRIVATLLNASDKEIILTSGGTESNNLAIKGSVSNKGRILCASIEHPSVTESFLTLEKLGFEWMKIPVSGEGIVDVDALKSLVTVDTKLVSVMYVNNETGSIQPIEEIGRWISNFNQKHKSKVLFHVDAVQGFGKLPIDVKKSYVDLMSFSGHKIHGLKGTGGLFVRSGIRLSSLFSGGQQEGGIRPGTENVLGIKALGVAAQHAHNCMRENYMAVNALKRRIVKELMTIEDIKINGNVEMDSPYLLNVSFRGTKGEVLLHALESQGVFVSTGSACSSKKKNYSKVLEAMGLSETELEGAIRFSFHSEITQEQELYTIVTIKQCVESIRKIIRRK